MAALNFFVIRMNKNMFYILQKKKKKTSIRDADDIELTLSDGDTIQL